MPQETSVSHSVCDLCCADILPADRWEYVRPYPVGTPEAKKRRVHGVCVSLLLRDTLRTWSQVPADIRAQWEHEDV
jgi:hypothetical protein